MALKIKVGLIGKLDMLKFKLLKKTREKAISKGKNVDIKTTFPINTLAKKLHPDFQELIVDSIIDHKDCDSKTFVFTGENIAYFKAGQYISFKLNINDTYVTSPYTISSSPKLALENKMTVTIKRVSAGTVSNYLLDTLKVGDKIICSDPQGSFYYQELRDNKNVIAIAGGSGITPFISMAKAILDNTEDFNLTILYGTKTIDSTLFKDELNDICSKTNKVKVVYVLSDEVVDGYENGFITSDLIKKYSEGKDCSIFICGPEAMYYFVLKEVAKLGLPKRLVRSEMQGVSRSIYEEEDFPLDAKNKTFNLIVHQGPNRYEIKANSNEPILLALEKNNIKAPSRCRSGVCGYCRTLVVNGSYYCPSKNEFRRYSDKTNNYIHACCSFPISDLEIIVPGEYIK